MRLADAPADAKSADVAWIPVAASTALVLILGVVDLGGRSLWSDEADTWYVTSQGATHLIEAIAAWDLHGTAYYAIVWLLAPFGDGESWLRLPSVVFAAATVPFVALLGTRLFDRWVGIVAAVLFAVHGSVLPFAQEARSYTLAFLLLAVSSLVLLLACERRQARWWGLWGGLVVALFLTHLFAAMVAGVVLVWALWSYPDVLRERSVQISVAVVGVFGGLITLVVFAQHTATPFEWTWPATSPMSYVRLARDLSGGSIATLVLTGVLATALLADTGVRLVRRSFGPPWPQQVLVVGAVAAPVLLAAAVSLVGDASYLVDRYLLAVAPFLAIALARGAQLLPWRYSALAVLGALIVASGLRSVDRYGGDEVHDFRRLTEAWLSQARPDDAVAFLTPYHRMGVAYYARDVDPDTLPVSLLPSDPWPIAWDGSYEVDAEVILSSLEPGQVLWLVVNAGERDEDDPDPRWDVGAAIERLEQQLGRPELSEFDGLATLALYRFGP